MTIASCFYLWHAHETIYVRFKTNASFPCVKQRLNERGLTPFVVGISKYHDPITGAGFLVSFSTDLELDQLHQALHFF